MGKMPEVIYYYRGVQEGTPVYSRANEFPWMSRCLCRQDAATENKRAVFVRENITNAKVNNERDSD